MLLAQRVPVDVLAPAARWRRVLQLSLAGLWLLDGVLQIQVFMFSHGFADSVADAAGGNPAAVAGPVRWTSGLIGAHGALVTIAIAVVEVLIGLGIAWRPTVRLALGASVAWALGVWWLGEGFGGLFTPDANVIAGAPGAVIIYAMLAVVLWPAGVRARSAGATGSAAAGGSAVASGPAATALWLLLWGGLAVLSLSQAVAAPGALGQSLADMAGGQPRWLASADSALAALLGHHGATASLAFAAVLAVIAASVFLPMPARRLVLGAAAALVVLLWTVGQAFGGILTGMATDPNSGPLLLLALAAYWPARATAPAGALVAARGWAGGASGPSATSRGWIRRDIDAMNILMAIAMASMLAGRLSPILEVVWLVTFAAASAWFSWHAVRVWLRRAVPGQHVMHLLSCGGMLVMLAAPRAGVSAMAMAGAGAAGVAGSGATPAVLVPTLAAVFAVAMAGTVVVLTDRLPALAGLRRWRVLEPVRSLAEPGRGAQPTQVLARDRPAGPGPRSVLMPRRAPVPRRAGATPDARAVTGAGAARSAGRPSLRLSCQIALGLAMACMLIQML